ncbi:hypothetical protein D3C86_1869040 [compost metagenome]
MIFSDLSSANSMILYFVASSMGGTKAKFAASALEDRRATGAVFVTGLNCVSASYSVSLLSTMNAAIFDK